MDLIDALDFAKKGIKITHEYFTPGEYMTVNDDNLITFEDGNTTNLDVWLAGKDYLQTGWRKFE